MKLLTPLLAIVKPFSQPSAPPRTSASAQASGTEQAHDLHQIAPHHDDADANRTHGEVHAAGRQHHHLRETDDDIDC